MRRLLRWSVVLLLLWGGWRLLPRLLEPWMPPPQMILVLGGDVEREKQAASLARQSNLPVLITGGSNPEYAQWVFEGQGVDAQKLQLDYAARDTLSNFTTLVDRLRRRGIRHVLLSPAVITWTGHCWWAVWWLAAAVSISPRCRCPVVMTAARSGAARFGVMGCGRCGW